MKLGKILYVTKRQEWRRWLAKHHASAKEIWLITYKKHTNKPSLPYNDAVEEALCYGWIDSIVKRIDEDRTAQRYSPRKPGSMLSGMNRERVRRLIRAKKMTKVGLAAIQPQLAAQFVIPHDIRAALQKDKTTWAHFQKFPASYRRIRVGWIDGARKRPGEFKKRLAYFLKMTAQNKQFGMVR